MNLLVKGRAYASSERGATSVLVIFMMIVLVSFGAFAITSSSVNYKFSKKALDWSVMYYSLDSIGEEYVMEVDRALARAETSAVEYIREGWATQREYSQVEKELQTRNYDRFIAAVSKAEALKETLNLMYMYYADIYLTELTEKYPDNQISALEDGGIVMSLNLNNESDANLKISLRVNLIDYTITYVNDTVNGSKDVSVPRYVIEDWSEWQTPVEYDDTQKLWDGI